MKFDIDRDYDLIFNLAMRLVDFKYEAVYVVYEDYHVRFFEGDRLHAIVPLYDKEHGYVRIIVHVHPLPRIAPSINDLESLIKMSKHRLPSYLAIVYTDNERIHILVIKASKPINMSVRELLDLMEYEELFINSDIDVWLSLSSKQLHELNYKLRNYGVSFERYNLLKYG